MPSSINNTEQQFVETWLWKIKKKKKVKKERKKQVPDPPSSWTLILCICKFVGTNSNFLSAFKLLALNEGPKKSEKTQ